MYLSLCLRLGLFCIIYVIYFSIIIFNFIAISYIILLKQTNLFLGHSYLKFNLRVLLSFCLIFCQFQPSFAYKNIAYKKGCSPFHARLNSVNSRSSHRKCSVKKVLLEISQNSQENTCARVSSLIRLQACN